MIFKDIEQQFNELYPEEGIVELINALKEYENTFNDGFPTFSMSGTPPEKMLEIVNECITKKQDVYNLGYLTLSEDVMY